MSCAWTTLHGERDTSPIFWGEERSEQWRWRDYARGAITARWAELKTSRRITARAAKRIKARICRHRQRGVRDVDRKTRLLGQRESSACLCYDEGSCVRKRSSSTTTARTGSRSGARISLRAGMYQDGRVVATARASCWSRDRAAESTKIVYHESQPRQGCGLRTGFAAATGDIVLVQDADLEYDPQEYPRLLKPILDGKAEVVFGCASWGDVGAPRGLFLAHVWATDLLTFLSNLSPT